LIEVCYLFSQNRNWGNATDSFVLYLLVFIHIYPLINQSRFFEFRIYIGNFCLRYFILLFQLRFLDIDRWNLLHEDNHHQLLLKFYYLLFQSWYEYVSIQSDRHHQIPSKTWFSFYFSQDLNLCTLQELHQHCPTSSEYIHVAILVSSVKYPTTGQSCSKPLLTVFRVFNFPSFNLLLLFWLDWSI